ncbi:MAG: PEP-CTERM sorting domain-containing protein [Verrucomicrobiales bacterium]
MKILFSLLTLSFALAASSPAAITAVSGGQTLGAPLQNVADWTVDLGFVVPDLPATPDRILFEAGGDGLGIALALIGSDLVVYQDQGDFNSSSPANDTWFTLDITPLAGNVATLRLDADLSTATDTISLVALGANGTALSNSAILPVNGSGVAGSNGTGIGRTNADLAGLDESVEPGFPNMAQFVGASYLGGANTLGPESLVGVIYSGVDQPPASIPGAFSWGLVPEPSRALLLAAGLVGVALRRRR